MLQETIPRDTINTINPRKVIAEGLGERMKYKDIVSPVHQRKRIGQEKSLEIFALGGDYVTPEESIDINSREVLNSDIVERIKTRIPDDMKHIEKAITRISVKEGLEPPETSEDAIDIYLEWLSGNENGQERKEYRMEYRRATNEDQRKNVVVRFANRRLVSMKLYLSWLQTQISEEGFTEDDFIETELTIKRICTYLDAVGREYVGDLTNEDLENHSLLWDMVSHEIMDEPTRKYLYDMRAYFPQDEEEINNESDIFATELRGCEDGILGQTVCFEALNKTSLVTENNWKVIPPKHPSLDVRYGVDLTVINAETGEIVCDISVKSKGNTGLFTYPVVDTPGDWHSVCIYSGEYWNDENIDSFVSRMHSSVDKKAIINAKRRNPTILVGLPRASVYNYNPQKQEDPWNIIPQLESALTLIQEGPSEEVKGGIYGP